MSSRITRIAAPLIALSGLAGHALAGTGGNAVLPDGRLAGGVTAGTGALIDSSPTGTIQDPSTDGSTGAALAAAMTDGPGRADTTTDGSEGDDDAGGACGCTACIEYFFEHGESKTANPIRFNNCFDKWWRIGMDPPWKQCLYPSGDSGDQVTAISVPTTGSDFTVKIAYTSDPEYGGSGLVGENWVGSPFLFVREVDNGGVPDLKLDDSTMRELTYVKDTGFSPARWLPGGLTDQYMVESTHTIGANTYATWKLVVPGRWERHYFRAHAGGGGITATPSHFEGLISYEQDAHGNKRDYEYTVYGDLVAAHEARLTKVTLTSGHSTPVKQAEVEFAWIDDDSLPNVGKLKSIKVFRSDDAWSTRTETKRAEFRYKATGDGLHASLGTEGDLIEMRRWTRLDDTTSDIATGWLRVNQWRYHGGQANESGTTDTDGDGFVEIGLGHQLKMAFLPEHIERLADTAKRNGVTAVTTVGDGADEMLTVGDGHAIYTGGGAPLLVDFASKVVSEYDTYVNGGRTLVRSFLTDCGCGGASTHGITETIDYYSYSPGSPTVGDVMETIRIDEYMEISGSPTATRSTYLDFGYRGSGAPLGLVTTAVVEAGGTDKWVEHISYDATSARPVKMMSVDAMTSYTPGTASVAPSYAASSTEGLVLSVEYESGAPYISEVRKGLGDQGGHNNFTRVLAVERNDSTRPDLPTKVKRYTVAATTTDASASGIRERTFAYTYASGGLVSVTTTFEARPASENGPNTAESTVALIDEAGQVEFLRDERSLITKLTFDTASSGAVASVISSVPNTDTDLGNSRYSGLGTSGWSSVDATVATSYGRDLLGRVTTVTNLDLTTAAVTTEVMRELKAPDASGIELLAILNLPVILDGSTDEFAGPLVRTYKLAGGKTLRMAEHDAVTGDGVNFSRSDPSANGASTEVTYTAYDYDVSGSLLGIEQQTTTVGGGEVAETHYSYDARGRVQWMQSPTGDYTRYTYFNSWLPWVTKVDVTNQTDPNNSDQPDPTAFTTVAQYFYNADYSSDFDPTNSSTDPYQEVGRGVVTHVREWVDASTHRDTRHWYDRDTLELLKTQSPAGPHTVRKYNEAGDLVERAIFTESTAVSGISDTTTTTGRTRYENWSYDSQGMQYLYEIATNPASGSPTFLRTDSYYDGAGNLLKVAGPSGPVVKHAYKPGTNLVQSTYYTDGGGDTTPADADNVAGDIVFEQIDFTYVDDSDLVDWTKRFERAHGAVSTDTGALSGLSGSKFVRTYARTYYDDANRPEFRVDWGTNNHTANTFKSDSIAAPNPSTRPNWGGSNWGSDFLHAIVTQTAYDEHGHVAYTLDPTGIETQYFYDSSGRQVAMVENDQGLTIQWDSGLGRYKVNSPGTALANADENRVTSFVYDAASRVVKRVAHLPDGSGGEKVQVTEYVYGTDAVVGSPPLTLPANEIESNSLLVAVKYPDESTGAPGDTAPYVVQYGYNRQGELIEMIDQNETTHLYTRDDLGRVTLDLVDAFGTGVDQWADRIAFTYDTDTGARTAATTKSGSTVKNEVFFDYDEDLGSSGFQGLWRISNVWQQTDGAVVKTGGTPSPKVAYAYTSGEERLATITYPSGDVLTHTYGSTAGYADSAIDRLSGYSFDGSDILGYTYVGLGRAAIVDYLVPDVLLDYSAAHNGTRTAGEYPGWDRFGRIQRQIWVDAAFTTNTASVPNIPPIVEREYAYDPAGNRTRNIDARPGEKPGRFNEVYDYDDLHRLTKSDRGDWSGSALTTVAIGGQDWDLDQLGNWDKHRRNADGSGTGATPSFSGTEIDERTHNEANELSQRQLDPSGTPVTLGQTFDANGNLRTSVREETPNGVWTYHHDAWNRLVKMEFDEDGAGSTYTPVEMARYEYNGLHWRTVSMAESLDGSSGLDRTTEHYYDASWRLLEEREEGTVSDGVDPPTYDTKNRTVQHVWGNRYIDDAVMHRIDVDGQPEEWQGRWWKMTDALFSVVALVRDNGDLAERVSYEPYGRARHHRFGDLDGDGDSETGTDAGILLGAWGSDIDDTGYIAEADLNRDGSIDGGDWGLHLPSYAAALPDGEISAEGDRYGASPGAGNSVGWGGLPLDPVHSGTIHRYRWSNSLLGRFVSRDPLESIIAQEFDRQTRDGLSKTEVTRNLYQYVGSRPLFSTDPTGLLPTDDFNKTSCYDGAFCDSRYKNRLAGCLSQQTNCWASAANSTLGALALACIMDCALLRIANLRVPGAVPTPQMLAICAGICGVFSATSYAIDVRTCIRAGRFCKDQLIDSYCLCMSHKTSRCRNDWGCANEELYARPCPGSSGGNEGGGGPVLAAGGNDCNACQ